jgi:hypothetical protein
VQKFTLSRDAAERCKPTKPEVPTCAVCSSAFWIWMEGRDSKSQTREQAGGAEK